MSPEIYWMRTSAVTCRARGECRLPFSRLGSLTPKQLIGFDRRKEAL